MFLPTSALAEVRSDASGYGAEYGRVVGGVTGVVTKSGTNNFHGDFLYIAQNQKWEAQSDDVPLPREDDIINSYEASIGGPIVRDKAWFFAAGGRQRHQPDLVAAPAATSSTNSVTSESNIGKLNFSPTPRHSLVGDLHRRAGGGAVLRHQLRRHLPRSPSTSSAAASRPRAGAGRRRTTCSSRCAAPTRTRARAAPCITTTEIVPGASPDDPAGNHGAYWDTAHHVPLARERAAAGRRACSSSRAIRPTRVDLVPAAERAQVRRRLPGRDVGDAQHVPDRYMGVGYNPNLPGGFVTPATKNVYRAIDCAGRDHQHQPRGLRAGPHRGRRPLDLQRRPALRGPGARERPRPGGAVVGGLHAAPGRDLRRRRRRQAADQGDRRPLPHAHHAGLRQRRVLDAAQRRQLVRPVPLEPGDAPLRHLRPHPAPARGHPAGRRRALLQGRGDRPASSGR